MSDPKVDMSFREMLTYLFNTDFLTSGELETIVKAGELYSAAKLKNHLKQESELLEELREYMFSRADADYQDEKYVGNQEMKFIQRIDEVLERIK